MYGYNHVWQKKEKKFNKFDHVVTCGSNSQQVRVASQGLTRRSHFMFFALFSLSLLRVQWCRMALPICCG